MHTASLWRIHIVTVQVTITTGQTPVQDVYQMVNSAVNHVSVNPH